MSSDEVISMKQKFVYYTGASLRHVHSTISGDSSQAVTNIKTGKCVIQFFIYREMGHPVLKTEKGDSLLYRQGIGFITVIQIGKWLIIVMKTRKCVIQCYLGREMGHPMLRREVSGSFSVTQREMGHSMLYTEKWVIQCYMNRKMGHSVIQMRE